MTSTAARVVRLLTQSGRTVGAAESLTGGLVTGALTGVPGASAVVRGGVVAYTPDVKVAVLGVSPEVLAEHGAVSRECAEAMAVGARRVLGTDWGVATTGVAGPGPSDGHPAGTVHVAVAGESGGAHRALHLDGDRAEVRRSTVEAALRLLEDGLRSGLSGPEGTVVISLIGGTEGAEEG